MPLPDIITRHEAIVAHLNAMRNANAYTARIQATTPAPDARELTLAEVAHGDFGDSAWRWPIPVLDAVTTNTGDLGDPSDDWADLACITMRALANLYSKGYRLVGPPVVTPVPNVIPTDDTAAAYLAGRGITPADSLIPAVKALREQWPALLLGPARDLAARLRGQ